ncbi:hypothetical protein BH18ACT5_BH18ACT5_19100 [soil metagenome]
MASRSTHQNWLIRLTDLPTASGKEDSVVAWVESWAYKRGHRFSRDEAGNVLLRSKTRSRKRQVVAVAHMDHPALVVTRGGTRVVEAVLRGGVHPQYVEGAAVETGSLLGRVVSHDPASLRTVVEFKGTVETGSIVRWRFHPAALGLRDGVLKARTCDDLAGVAAALAALDVSVSKGIDHFGVLLTRAEEVGLVGAIAACKLETIAKESRVLSIECSRASSDAPVGAGPVVRVGDASSAFSPELTNALSAAARASGIKHQRKLMAGGSCEATAFCAYGYEASGLCLPLNNYHNMADIAGVLAGKKKARLAPEEIATSDFHGLVDLLVSTAATLDASQGRLRHHLDDMFDSERHVLTSEA